MGLGINSPVPGLARSSWDAELGQARGQTTAVPVPSAGWHPAPPGGSDPIKPLPWLQTHGEARKGAVAVPLTRCRHPGVRGGSRAPEPPQAVPLLTGPGWGMAAGCPRPSRAQMARAASTGGPVPRQIGAGCLLRAREGLRPRHGSGTRVKAGSGELRGQQGQLQVPALLCPPCTVPDPVLAPEPC